MTTKAMLPVPVSFLYMTRQGASNVELAGSFNNWSGVAMERGPWEWRLTLELPPGQHQYKFIVDGKWVHHQGKPTTKDGMGGINNVVSVDKKQGANSTVEFVSTGDAKIHRENRLGTYVKTGQTAQGRPVFQQSSKEEGKKQYFLYVGPGDCWRVGPDITSYSGSVIKHPRKNQNLPPRTGWNYYFNDKWNTDDSLEATVKLRGTRDEKKYAFSKSQLAKKPSPDVKPALMVALEADFEKLKEKGKLDWLVNEQGMDLDDCKELLSRLDEDLNEELGMFGPTPLMVAATFGWEEVCKVLLSAGADVDISLTSWGSRDSPLLAAASGGWPDICQLFLSAGADINQRNLDGYGKTALDIAKDNDHSEVVALLEKHGASVSELSLDLILEFHKISKSQIDEEDEDTELTPLTYAATIGHKDACKILIDAGADVNKANGATALLIAAEYGKSDICRMLISAGAEVDKANEYMETALHYAADKGHTDICKMLLEAGADVNKQTDYGWTPLMKSLRGNVTIAKMLLSAGADVRKKNSDGATALFFAASFGHTEFVRIILELDADVAAEPSKHDRGRTPLMEAAEGGYAEICKMLLKAGAGAELDKQNEDGDTALTKAANGGWADVCDILLSGGADINKKNYHHYGDTALDIAKEENNVQVVAVLEKHGASASPLQLADILKKHAITTDTLNKEDEDGDTALIYAAKIGNGGACKLLLEAGADVNKMTENGDLALSTAAGNGDADTCKILMKAGADVNKEHGGWTPLTITIHNKWGYEPGFEEIIKMLLNAGVDVNKPTLFNGVAGPTPLFMAVRGNDPELVKILIDAGADVNFVIDGETPLMRAARGYEEVCQLLIDGGAELDKEDEDGRTALAIAAKNEAENCCTMLIKAGASLEEAKKREKEEGRARLYCRIFG